MGWALWTRQWLQSSGALSLPLVPGHDRLASLPCPTGSLGLDYSPPLHGLVRPQKTPTSALEQKTADIKPHCATVLLGPPAFICIHYAHYYLRKLCIHLIL